MKQDIDINNMYPNSFMEAELNVKRVFEYLKELHKRFEYRKKVEHSFNDFHVICALGNMKPSDPKSLKIFMDYALLNDEQKAKFIFALRVASNSRYGILAEPLMMSEKQILSKAGKEE